MLPVDHIRYQILRARQKATTEAARDATLASQMTDALIEERRNTGSATVGALTARYGFTLDEITRLGRRAIDAATARFVDRRMVDPVAA